MIEYEDRCVGCSSMGLPCYGSSCSNRHVPVYICDECGDEEVDLYEFDDGRQLCERCLVAQFKKVGE